MRSEFPRHRDGWTELTIWFARGALMRLQARCHTKLERNDNAMQPTHARNLFINLPVREPAKSRAFFAALNFEFDNALSGDSGVCMTINEYASVMLLRSPYFQQFTRHQVCDTTTHCEGLFALTCQSRAEVDEVLARALAAGASPAMEPRDYGHMYTRSFYDLDGHQWEVFWLKSAGESEGVA
jgi:predicted lactoylglutathione lyase